MTDHPTDGLFDALVAPRYGATLGAQGTAEMIDSIVDFLVDQARGGRVLEFAVGTGRIALPLAARGVEVHGIELSRAMLMQLRRKGGRREAKRCQSWSATWQPLRFQARSRSCTRCTTPSPTFLPKPNRLRNFETQLEISSPAVGSSLKCSGLS